MTVFSDMGNYSTLSPSTKSRDPRWLQVEVCREFSRDRCLRSDDECRFAHPPAGCLVEDGKVTACFDAMKGRCQRDKCKYLHPPDHIKSHLETLGRSFQHNRSRTLSQQAMLSEMLGEMTIHPVSTEQYPGYQSHLADQTYLPTSMEPIPVNPRSLAYPRRTDKSDKLKVCDDFLNGCCALSEDNCSYAHSPEHIAIDADGFVTVCMDYVKGHCQRNSCRYFHPPKSMVTKVRAAQYRPMHYGKIMQQNAVPYPQGPPSYMFMPPYYQQQVLNAPLYSYQSYVPHGMPQQAFMMPTFPYGVPSPPPYAAMLSESPVAFSPPSEMQAGSIVPTTSPVPTAHVDVPLASNGTAEPLPVQ